MRRLLVALAVGSLAVSPLAAAEPAVVAWTAPSSARVLAWSAAEGAQEGSAREVAPDEPIALGAGEVLLVPVDPGTPVEVVGRGARLGLGLGGDEVPAAIAWPRALVGPRAQVPEVPRVRFLAVRTEDPRGTTVRVRVGAPAAAPLAWHRLDAEVRAWLAGGPAPIAPPAGAAPIVATLRPARPAAAQAVFARWRAASLAVRPLDPPYFASTGPGDAAGVAVGRPLVLDATVMDVAIVALHASAGLDAAVTVDGVAGGVRRVSIPGGDRAILRLVPVQDRLIVRVRRGQVAAAVTGYRQRASILGPRLPRAGAVSTEPVDTRAALVVAQPIDAVLETVEVTPTADEDGRSDCGVAGPAGPRWTVLPAGRTAYDIDAPAGAIVSVPIRALPDTPLPETVVRVDGEPVTVHAGAGLTSWVGLRAGRHVLERAAAEPRLVARLPRRGRAPCEALRILESWARVEERVAFAVPEGAGPLWLAWRPAPSAPPVRTLRVRGPSGDVDLWLRADARESVALPVDRPMASLEVASDGRVLLRVLASAGPRSLLTPSPPLLPELPAPDRPALLAEVRAATAELRAPPPQAARRLVLLARADALEALGANRLAERDRQDAGGPLPGAARRRATAGPGWLGRVPPLPLPQDLGPLRAARSAWARDDAAAAAALLAAPAAASSGADALLLLLAADAAGDATTAAQAAERLGREHRSAAAWARAAGLWADVAIATNEPRRALLALALAERALQAGEPTAGPVLARLGPAVRWTSAVGAEALAGSAVLDVGPAAPSPMAELRLALVDAPPEAQELESDDRLEAVLVRRTPARLSIDGRGRVPGPADAFAASIDGRPVVCPGGWLGPASDAPACELDVPAGAHRVEVVAPTGVEALAWVTIRERPAGGIVPGRVLSRWWEIEPGRPLEIDVAAPTVVRVAARGAPGQVRTLRLTADPELSMAEPWVLPSAPDPAAQRRGAVGEIAVVDERRLALAEPGSQRVRIACDEGRALVRVEVAIAVGPPRPRSERPAPPSAPLPLLTSRARTSHERVRVGADPAAGLLAAEAWARLVDTSLAQADTRPRTRFAESGVGVRRALVADHVWARLAAFGRVRAGAPSGGVMAEADASSGAAGPGAFARARVVGQSGAVGARAEAGPLWAIRLTQDVRLVPWAGLRARWVDPAQRGATDADRDVWDAWDRSHPRDLAVGARLLGRPFVDLALQGALEARSTPDLVGIDRLDLSFDADLLAGRGLAPWLGLTAATSLRLAGDGRSATFLRSSVGPRAMVWRWWAGVGRAALSAEGLVSFDAGASPRPGPVLSGVLSLAVDLVARRGLSDRPPVDRPVRDRLEEGSGRAPVRRPPREPRWEAQ
jgi:hypothetical protein